MGDFEKKFPASACRKKKIACSTNVIEKNSCTAVRKKKNVAKLFHHSGGLYKSQQNCNHSLPLLCLTSGFYLVMLQNYCFICAMHY